MKIICLITALILILCSFSLSGYAHRSGEKEQNFCAPFYSDIKDVKVAFEAKTPYQMIAWRPVVNLVVRQSAAILKEGNINFEVLSEPTKDLNALPEDTLYAKLFFSYVDKKSFSIEPQDSKLASWIEYSRRMKNAKGEIKLITKTSKMNFMNAAENPEFISLSSAATGLLEPITCAVIKWSAGKQCSNNRSYSVKYITPYKEKCVPFLYDDDFFENIPKEKESTE